MLRHSRNATADTDTIFPPFRPITRIQLSRQRPRVGAEAGSLFSRTCETRFRYRRRVLFILRLPLRPSGNDVIRHCRFHCDSRIAVHYLESANSAVLDCASAPRHSNSAVLLLALISEPGIHKFQGEDPLEENARG